MECPLCKGRLAYKIDLPKKAQRVFECKSCGRWFAISHMVIEDYKEPWSVS